MTEKENYICEDDSRCVTYNNFSSWVYSPCLKTLRFGKSKNLNWLETIKLKLAKILRLNA